MLKSVVLCVIVWHEMCQFSSHAHPGVTDTRVLNFPPFVSPKINHTDVQTEPRVTYNFNITQIFYVSGPLLRSSGLDRNLNSTDNVSGAQLSRDECYRRSQGASSQAESNQSQTTESATHRSPVKGYLVTKGIGAHKLHSDMSLSWSDARRFCINEGGELAVIRSVWEATIVLQMMVDAGMLSGWLGFHDQFGTGNWTSVFGEPLGENGWEKWQKSLIDWDKGKVKKNAARCANLWHGGGMTNDDCDREDYFICKISTL